jgi:hypothetical protein
MRFTFAHSLHTVYSNFKDLQDLTSTGVYLLNCPWFSCSLTHYSVGKQATQLHPLAGVTWVLQNASTVKIFAHQSLCSIMIVHSWPKKVYTEQTYMDKCRIVYSKFARLAQNLPWVCTFQNGGISREKNPF